MTMTSSAPEAAFERHDDVNTVGRRWRTGVLLIILADASFVAALLFSYFYLRGLNTQGNWIPARSATAPIWQGWAITLVLVLSAAAYRWGELGIRKGDRRRLQTGSTVALVLLLVDIVAQAAQMSTFPFRTYTGSYASAVIALAGANLFHLLLTLFVGVGLLNRTRLGKYDDKNHWQVRLGRIWWAWIAAASVATALTTSFVAGPKPVVPAPLTVGPPAASTVQTVLSGFDAGGAR